MVWFPTVDFGIHLSDCLLLTDCHQPPTLGSVEETADRGEEDEKSRGRREREKHKGEGGRIKNLKRRNLNGEERLLVSGKTPHNSQTPT